MDKFRPVLNGTMGARLILRCCRALVFQQRDLAVRRLLLAEKAFLAEVRELECEIEWRQNVDRSAIQPSPPLCGDRCGSASETANAGLAFAH